MTLIDTNVLLDVLSQDRDWLAWSADMLERRASDGPLLINEAVYAELSARMDSEQVVDRSIAVMNVQLERTPKQALFLAGQAFRKYRRTGGTRTGVLPDLFIGAHAQILKCPLLTRDLRRFRTYFPDVTLITPEQ